ncbi:hypothetical protein GCM10011391_02870 [Pullulanibacillus camelliae]|uniref:Uncharacterized protein n=1 Tax=Pullulanibacillus camelliae TaxID=1707096 RepID=A0A8J2YE94_9BACL|nr:plasmid pRiA4b ORF-3 family protein [Pullulanibacillus camelliae]GGE27806.1 hypothetical protein GCM10011391_02870 [Pullulanibacillus camelliae]
MLIQCSKKLLDQLKIKPQVQNVAEPFFSWHANLMMVNRRKTIVLVNDLHRYVIVLYGLKAKDFKNLPSLITSAIRETYQQEGIKEELVEKYLKQAPQFFFSKTKDRTSVARMNKACETVGFFDYEVAIDPSLINVTLSRRASQNMYGAGKNSYIYPYKELIKAFESFSTGSVYNPKAAIVKITLRLGNHKVWRRLVIPVYYKFNRLHKTLQQAFGWQNYHLHEFQIYKSKTTLPFITLVDNEEAFEIQSDTTIKLEREVSFSEYLSEKIRYVYDFGDYWEHDIKVEEIIEDYDKNYPVCLAGNGAAPPEDVGGEFGYDHFLKIMADKNHPNYEEMTRWAEQQGYQDFDRDQVNKKLERM